MQNVDFMLDLETLSTRGDAAITQISCVAFDPLTGAELDHFDVYVRDSKGHIDPKTVAWWLQQEGAGALGSAMLDSSSASESEALAAFRIWYAQHSVQRVWCHGLTFDVPILSSALARHGMAEPWSYRTPRDTRTLYDLAGGMPSVPMPEVYVKHDALSDCRLQAAQVVAALGVLRSKCQS